MRNFFVTTILILFFIGVATPVLAFPSLIPEECVKTAELDMARGKCVDCKLGASAPDGVIPCCCNLSSVERTAVNVSQIILGVTGALALLMFVFGGVMYILSGGDSGKISKATDILKNAVIGIAIILLAGLAVQLILKKLTS